MNMLKFYLSLTSLLLTLSVHSQGISFSYLFPKNGYLAAPVSPFSVRGLGIGEHFGIETGGSLYNIPGLAMSDLPFHSQKPLVGPYLALFVPVELFVNIPMNNLSIKFMAGGFTWWNINPRINEGNMDRALRSYEKWEVLNSNLSLHDHLGFGMLGGVELEFFLNKRLSLMTAVQYLQGSSRSSLSGTYTGGNDTGLETKSVNFTNTSIQLSGLEMAMGVIFHQ